MHDRFKFRAWNKLSNEMKDVISLNINHSFPDCSNVILETNTFDNIKTHNNPITCANSLENVVLMQCTGLKDKNGKLIYEWDIVKFKKNNPVGILKGVIQNHTCYFSLDFMELGKYGESGCSLTKNTTDYIQLEVIGNIYENKKLLEVN